MSATVLQALDAALRVDAARPLVTFYDGETGERIELSVRTFDNWVSKVANLLGDELMLGAGDSIRVDLPPHWQSAVAVAGAWAAGLRLVGGATPADVVVVGPEPRADPGPAGSVLAVSLRPLGGPFAEPLPEGWLDFAREVPPQPDALLVPAVVGPEDVAVETADGPRTHGELVEAAIEAAAAGGLSAGGRLMTDLNPASPDDVVDALVAPIVSGAGVVLIRNASNEQSNSIAAQEEITSMAVSAEHPS